MRSRITKPAIAATIAVAVLIGINLTGRSGVAFADIVKPFLAARTATFKMTMEVQGAPTQTFDCMYAEPIRMRQTSTEQGVVIISDLLAGRIVTLYPARNRAMGVEMDNVPDDPNRNQFNMFGEIRRHIQEVQQAPDDSVTSLGERQIGGRTAVGYHVRKPGLDITVWADLQTQLPVEIKSVNGPAIVTLTDLVFDVDLDESLFDLTITNGYEVGTLRADATEPTEQDLLDTFRLWAEHANGNLPPSLDIDATRAFILGQRNKLIQAGREPSREDMLRIQQTTMDMGRGITFVEQLPADSDWHYAGKGVTFGDAATPIFWYRPEGSGTYRVIYGDVNVREVTASELPKVPDSQPVSNKAETSDGGALVDKAVARGADIPPENRSLVSRMLSLSEKDLIGGLKTFAELSGGRYPNELDAKSTIKEADGLGADVLAGVSEQVKKQKLQDIFFATAYHDKLVREKKDVAYYGDAVSATDAGKVLIRWKTSRDRYRVVFGDLTAKDVTADELKKLEGR
jgi:outer membrane lipoprotein-sorting protein